MGGQDVDMRVLAGPPRRSRFDIAGELPTEQKELLRMQTEAFRSQFAAEPPPYQLAPPPQRTNQSSFKLYR